MSVSIVFAIAGVIALLFGIIGGGVKAKEIEIPFLSVKARIITVFLGLILIGMTFWLENQSDLATTPGSTLVITPSSIPIQPDTPQTTSTPEPPVTVIIEQTPTSSNTDLEKQYSKLYNAKTWDLVFRDTFDHNSANWTLWNNEDSIKKQTMQIDDGVFRWGLTIKDPDWFFEEIAPVFSYSNFYYSVKIRRVGESSTENNAAWGILFRRKGSKYYTFRVNDVQEYAVQIYNEGDWSELIGWTRSSLVEQGKSNELTVIADNSDLFFFINNTPIGKINDETYSEGNVGFLAGLNFVNGNEVFFEFDDFELRQKPEN